MTLTNADEVSVADRKPVILGSRTAFKNREATVKRYGLYALTHLRVEGNFKTVKGAHPRVFDRAASLSLACARGVAGVEVVIPWTVWLAQTSPGGVHPLQGKAAMKRLDDCSENELSVLFLILTLALQLPGDLSDYPQALGELRRKYFKKNNPKRVRDVSWRNSRGSNGCVDGHQTRVTSPWKSRKEYE